MTNTHFDTLIIGSGPGGEGAAMKLAKSGQRVAVVEQYARVGGGCIHWGTIPSKALRHAIQVVSDFRQNPLIEKAAAQIELDYPRLFRLVEQVIDHQVATRDADYERNHVTLIHGHARFVDGHTIEVSTPELGTECYTADSFVIATGSRPYRPDALDFTHPRILDSDSVLALRSTPSSMTIYGAGAIGCEYASIFCNLGVRVNLVNTRDRLLGFLDDEITDALSYHLREQGTVIRHNETFASVEQGDDGVVLHCESGKQFKSDVLLWANGRSGSTEGLNLNAIGIEPNHRGQIPVDDAFSTEVDNVYAVGDVVGPPALASASYDQGRFVGARIAGDDSSWRLITDIPHGIYTSPEISSLGRTERELTQARVPYEVGLARFANIARAQITGHTVGMLKLLFHRETLEILGIHCFGEQASEIVHIGQAIMTQKNGGNNLNYFSETTFNYPTMAEAYRIAALNGLNRIS
ncbi:MAG TPA: Si-specific NAD(P)(+) transhydrogenase [Chromatiales bacterium]|jgi:NAD(P) transhydrogenase|nr:Si-specific NAD(P)(+) transhydrogenase [Chromatiales bacterium]